MSTGVPNTVVVLKNDRRAGVRRELQRHDDAGVVVLAGGRAAALANGAG